ncbi:MAG: alpha/beta hydrolase-fold protein [Alphaproteobacteria bacterium]|nr:alpha/beta hydrolase-fold protein [Alphaproteobacteria bacterium]
MRRIILLVLTVIVSIVVRAPLAAAKPYAIPNTQEQHIRSKFTGAGYRLFISLPDGYSTSGKSYPVVYMLDADYSFALVRNVVQHFVERQDLPPLILVAIAYPGAASSREVYRMNRTRDYTPVYAPDGGYGAEYQKVSGGAARFRAFFARELTPYIERRYRASPSDRTIIGHSYGGLFATYVLLTEPELFRRYIAVSPSLWYANRIALTMADDTADTMIKPGTRAFFAVGALENSNMIDDLNELVRKLRRRDPARLQMSQQIFEKERHNSVFPGAVTRGLLTVFAPSTD